MATLYVVHASADAQFVRTDLLPLLPTLEFESWLSAEHLGHAGDPGEAAQQARAMSGSAGILVVISVAAVEDPRVRAEAALAVSSGKPLVPFRRDDAPSLAVTPGLDRFPSVDGELDQLWTALHAIPLDDAPREPEQAVAIAWSPPMFTRVLAEFLQ